MENIMGFLDEHFDRLIDRSIEKLLAGRANAQVLEVNSYRKGKQLTFKDSSFYEFFQSNRAKIRAAAPRLTEDFFNGEFFDQRSQLAIKQQSNVYFLMLKIERSLQQLQETTTPFTPHKDSLDKKALQKLRNEGAKVAKLADSILQKANSVQGKIDQIFYEFL